MAPLPQSVFALAVIAADFWIVIDNNAAVLFPRFR